METFCLTDNGRVGPSDRETLVTLLLIGRGVHSAYCARVGLVGQPGAEISKEEGCLVRALQRGEFGRSEVPPNSFKPSSRNGTQVIAGRSFVG